MGWGADQTKKWQQCNVLLLHLDFEILTDVYVSLNGVELNKRSTV